MRREFVELESFRKAWDNLNLTDEDLKTLEIELLNNPEIGALIQGTGGVRKMRFAFENQGKSGSARVIYVDFEIKEKLYLLGAYAKNVKESLTQEEKNSLKKLTTILKQI